MIRQAQPLLDFCNHYLTQNRPVEVFAVDANYGVMLSNHRRFIISPGQVDLRGTMQDAGAVVGISEGLSQVSQEGTPSTFRFQ